MPTTALGILGLGFVLGLRHALDVDHLAAVSTIVSQRRGFWSSSLVGAVWGLGHTAALLAAAVAVIALRTEIPERLAQGLELSVAVMLVGLGLNLLWTLRRGGQLPLHGHDHGGRYHVHVHVHAPAAVDAADGHHAVPAVRRPFLVGLVHGLAGSAALMLSVLGTIPSRGLAFAYVGIFGCGSIGGMVAMSVLLALPLALATRHFRNVERPLRVCAGIGSVVVGVVVAWGVVAVGGPSV